MIENIKVGYKINCFNSDFPYNSDYPIYNNFEGIVDEVGTLYRFNFDNREYPIVMQEVPYIRVPCDDDARQQIINNCGEDYAYADYQYLVEDNVCRSIISQTVKNSTPTMIYIGKVRTVSADSFPFCYLLENDIEKAKKLLMEFYDTRIKELQSTIQKFSEKKDVILNTNNIYEVKKNENCN